MPYPDNRYPDSPDFPAVTNQADFDLNLYNVITAYITDLSAAMDVITGTDGNINLAAAKAIEWASSAKLTWSSSKVQGDTLAVDSPWSFGTLAPAGDCDVSNDLTIGAAATMTLSGNLAIAGKIEVDTITDSSITLAQIAEPVDPADGKTVLWLSNGTGVGDVGDIMIKIQHNSVVKSTTLVNFV